MAAHESVSGDMILAISNSGLTSGTCSFLGHYSET